MIWVKLIWVKKKKTNVARHVSVDVVIKIRLFDTSDFSIHEITAGTKLTRHKKVKDQIDASERLGTKLKYGVKDKDHLCSLPYIFSKR